jgi:type IV pilus assembly protein PilO
MDIKGLFANIPPRQLYVLTGIIAIGIVAGWWFYLFKPTWDERDRLQGDLARTEQDLFQKRRIGQELPKLEAALADLRRDLDAALTKLPEEKEIPRLLTQISRLGQESGLTFTLFKPGNPVKRDFYAEIPIQIKVDGSYHALGRFFDRLSRMDRIINVTDLKIAQSTARADSKSVRAIITAEFTATTFAFGGSKG